MADLPDLTHQWLRPKAGGWWECKCGAVTASRLREPELCPVRIAAWGAEQRAAGAAKERAAVVALLRDGPDSGRGTVAWDATVGPIRAELAYIIEHGEHLPLEVTDGK